MWIRAVTVAILITLVSGASVGDTAGALCPAYRPDGSYPLLINSEPVLQSKDVTLVGGVPAIEHGPGRYRRNPDTTATYGLQAWERWREHRDAAALATMRTAADWLVTHQTKGGYWPYGFAYRMASVGIDVTLAPGWVAGQAQGDSIALLMRAYLTTRDARYLRAARRAVAPYQRSVNAHGIQAEFRGHVFFDGFPSSPPSLILEDFDLSLLGLADVAPYDKRAGVLFKEGLRSL